MTVVVTYANGDSARYQGVTAAYSTLDTGEVYVTWTMGDGARGKATVARGAWVSVSEIEPPRAPLAPAAKPPA